MDWQTFKLRYLAPNPYLIIANEVYEVGTDEEAERIVEMIPTAHCKVVKKGVVMSEYWGKKCQD